MCASGAYADDGGALLCYTPEAAQVNALAAAVNIAAQLLEATTGDRALQVGPQALVLRIENIYEEAGDVSGVMLTVHGLKDHAA